MRNNTREHIAHAAARHACISGIIMPKASGWAATTVPAPFSTVRRHNVVPDVGRNVSGHFQFSDGTA